MVAILVTVTQIIMKNYHDSRILPLIASLVALASLMLSLPVLNVQDSADDSANTLRSGRDKVRVFLWTDNLRTLRT